MGKRAELCDSFLYLYQTTKFYLICLINLRSVMCLQISQVGQMFTGNS